MAAHVEAPGRSLARRLAQIGVVAREQGAAAGWSRAQDRAAAGVAAEGDVWRWDGFVGRRPCADRRGKASRRARARLVDIENELEQAGVDAGAKRQALEAAEAELKAASAAETSGRDAWRAAQREADSARERHAAA